MVAILGRKPAYSISLAAASILPRGEAPTKPSCFRFRFQLASSSLPAWQDLINPAVTTIHSRRLQRRGKKLSSGVNKVVLLKPGYVPQSELLDG